MYPAFGSAMLRSLLPFGIFFYSRLVCLEPMIKITTMLQDHRYLILNYFITKKEFNSGIVEGLNRKVNLTVRKAFGYRSFDVMETALYVRL